MKRFFVVLLTIVIIFMVVLYMAMTNSNTSQPFLNSPSPTPYGLQTLNTWEGVTPGKSTERDILETLGKPESVINKGPYQTYFFPSTNLYWKNEVSVSNQSVIFIKERLFPPSELSFNVLSKQITGEAIKLYGPIRCLLS